MADIKLKSINELYTWNAKELRKLRMNIRNRLSAFAGSSEPKELPANHPLYGKEADECKQLLENVIREEKKTK